MQLKFDIEVLRHQTCGKLVKKTETISRDICLSEILGAYPGYVVSDISFFPAIGFVNIYLKKEAK